MNINNMSENDMVNQLAPKPTKVYGKTLFLAHSYLGEEFSTNS